MSISIRAGPSDGDAEYDDLGAWSRLKRTLTRRWTSQISIVDDASSSTTTLEEGGAEGHLAGEKLGSAANFMQVQGRTDAPEGMLELPVPQSRLMMQEGMSLRPSSGGKASDKGSSNRNSGVMVEEEAATWLEQYGRK